MVKLGNMINHHISTTIRIYAQEYHDIIKYMEGGHSHGMMNHDINGLLMGLYGFNSDELLL